MSKRAKIIWSVLITGHLAMVILGASHVFYPLDQWWGRMLDGYGAFTGASSGYSFFAPSVGTEFRASFIVEDQAGHEETIRFDTDRSQEIKTRIGNLTVQFFQVIDSPEIKRSVAASWAGKVFALHPEARQVTMLVEAYDLPSMARFREGMTPGWRPLYTGKFIHEPRTAERGVQ